MVKEDSKLIRDSLKNIFEQYEKETLTLTFPDIIDKIKGTDSNIEIIKSSTLQTMRMDIVGSPITESRCYIFIQPELQNEELPSLKYANAEKRFTEIHEFFMKDL